MEIPQSTVSRIVIRVGSVLASLIPEFERGYGAISLPGDDGPIDCTNQIHQT